MFHTELYQHMNMGVPFVVCDAGGSTIDTTAYYVRTISPVLELDETKASACVQAGGVSVDDQFQKYLSLVLDQLGLPEDQKKNACEMHPEILKRMSKRPLMTYLKNEIIASFFNDSVETAVDCIRQQMDRGCEHILLVGGLEKMLCHRHRDPNAKAVADGSVLWCAKRTVVSVPLEWHMDLYAVDGVEKVRGTWSQIVEKVAPRMDLWKFVRSSRFNWNAEGTEETSGSKGEYYTLDLKVAIQFGDTELKAFLEWEYDGETFTGPAVVLPNEME
ncbi:hypothetical protein B0J17DRAFT_723819 [Rhizoctonia solani]|nr:hypothetical protein B0J17DRAFT_723819 [Rhizoctonia solani]